MPLPSGPLPFRALGAALLGALLLTGVAAPATAQAPAQPATAAAAEAAEEPHRRLTLAALRSDPARYHGQLVQWRVQYLGLERADPLRTDIGPSEPYLLVRDPGGEPGFVYVVVPEEWAAAVQGLAPLQRIQLIGRIRDGRSRVTGHPVLELIALLD